MLVDQLSEVLLSLVEKPESRSYKTFLLVIAATTINLERTQTLQE